MTRRTTKRRRDRDAAEISPTSEAIHAAVAALVAALHLVIDVPNAADTSTAAGVDAFELLVRVLAVETFPAWASSVLASVTESPVTIVDLYKPFRAAVGRILPNHPVSNLYDDIVSLDRLHRRDVALACRLAERCLDNIHVHLVEDDCPSALSSLAQKRAWSASAADGFSSEPPSVHGEEVVFNSVLRRHSEPSLDVVLVRSKLAADPRRAALLSAESLSPLDKTLYDTLDIASLLSPAEPTPDDGLIRFIRFDVGPNAKWNVFASVQRRRVDASIRARKKWARSSKRDYGGVGAGVGLRNDQRGSLGWYSNWLDISDSKLQALVSDHKCLDAVTMYHHVMTGEKIVVDILLGMISTILPSYAEHLRTETTRSGLPPMGSAGIATSIAMCRGYDSILHQEHPGDAPWSSGISFGGNERPGDDEHPFAFVMASIDGGRGLVIENGSGCVMLWAGETALHGTARAWPVNVSPAESDCADKLDSARAIPIEVQYRGIGQYQKTSVLRRQERLKLTVTDIPTLPSNVIRSASTPRAVSVTRATSNPAAPSASVASRGGSSNPTQTGARRDGSDAVAYVTRRVVNEFEQEFDLRVPLGDET